MEATLQILKLSELINGAHPLTGASTLTSSKPQQSNPHPNPSSTKPQTPEPRVLKPLNFPAVLVGTLTLPSHFHSKQNNLNSDSNSKCSCFRFDDGSATICCDILDFHPNIIGRKIRVLAWNFLPIEFQLRSCGFVEIIGWEFVDDFPFPASFPLFSLGVDCNDDDDGRYSIFGLLESVSPPCVVPCLSDTRKRSRNLSCFLAKILVCECKLCKRKYSKKAFPYYTEVDHKDHRFTNTLVILFAGPASSWHPVFSRLVKCAISLSRLVKKMVLIGEERSQVVMFVTTNKTSLCLPKLQKELHSNKEDKLRWLGEVGCYAGTVTGIYMQGMVIELDESLLLLLTDHQLMVPHSLRVGAIIFVRNTHFLRPKFSWTKVLVLGACCITSISVESFSPLETECHIKSNTDNVLRKLLGSLTFPARLWVLLVVSCLRKKFGGILLENDILSAKHNGGLEIAFVTSHLPSSVYRDQHGVFTEYCKHGTCKCSSNEDYSLLKLVIPFSYLVTHCEKTWIKMLLKHENDYCLMGTSNQHSFTLCNGRSYMKSIRRFTCCDDFGVILLGNLKVCSYSGRLQLADATGSVDVVVSDIPSTWDFSMIYEVEEFSVIMQGLPHKLDQSSLKSSEVITCKNIFGHCPSLREAKLSLYLYYSSKDQKSLHMCPPHMNSGGTSHEPEGGNYHLLWLRHKFPLLQEAHQGTSNRSSAFAECIMLPWKLDFSKKDALTDLTGLTMKGLQNTTRYPSIDGFEENTTLEKGETGVGLCKPPDSWSFDARSMKYGPQADHEHLDPSNRLKSLCLVSTRNSKVPFQGFLHCTDAKALTNSGWEPDGQKLVLEFDSEVLYLYQGLRIGSFYIVKHHEKDAFSNAKFGRNETTGSISISRETIMWSISFSPRNNLNKSDSSSTLIPPSSSFFSTNEIMQEFKLRLPSTNVGPAICTDVTLFMHGGFISYLKRSLRNLLGTLQEGLDKCNISPELSSVTSCSNVLLPEGNLVSLHGLVLAVHNFEYDSVDGYWRNESCCSHQPVVYDERSSICIHVLVGYHTAKIFGTGKKQMYPTEFGEGVQATFYRVLVMSGQKHYMLTPASFIVVNAANIAKQEDTAVSGFVSLGQNVDVFPAALISEVTESMDDKPRQLHGRIVSPYILVLESKREADYSNLRAKACEPIFEISLAGFVFDDGSSSCCCWTNHERAATMLKLHFESNSEEARGGTSKRPRRTETGKVYGSKVARLNNILSRHGRVVVKNCRVFDPSRRDLTFSVDSDNILSYCDKDFLKRFIFDAFPSATWTIVGARMDSAAVYHLGKQLNEVKMGMLPLKNIWASGVSHNHPLSEARQTIQELMDN